MGSERNQISRDTRTKRSKRKRAGDDTSNEVTHTPGVSNRDNLSTQHILQLQHTVGNRAVQQLVSRTPTPTIQRMPTQNMVIQQLGKPRKNILGVKQSTKYKKALATLKDLNDFLLATPLANNANEIKEQLKMIMRLYDPIISACGAYEGEKGEKAAYFLQLKVQAQNEKGQWIGKMMQLAANPGQFGGRQPVLSNVSPTSSMPLNVDETKFKKEVGGGINKLQVYEGGGDDEHYFKQNRDKVENISAQHALAEIMDLAETDPELFAQKREEIFAQDALNMTVENAGIDKNDARMAARDVATSRLDSLLGANVITRTQFALRKVGNESKLGSMMMGAKGKTGAKFGQEGGFDPERGGKTSLNDPDLQRMLSRLQLMDNLAYQVDRNHGNFYIHTNDQGKVIAVTGIDNDASFGTESGNEARMGDYPGFAKFVDKELAERIMSLDIELLELAMTDLLTPGEMDALFTRLAKLQAHLASIETKLLEPEQWDEAVSKGMLDEHSARGNKSTTYFGSMRYDLK